MKRSNRLMCVAAILGTLPFVSRVQAQSLWDLAQENKEALGIATLFTAQDVRDRLSTDQGIETKDVLRGNKSLALWNPHTGDKEQLETTVSETDGQSITTVPLVLQPLTSVFYVQE